MREWLAANAATWIIALLIALALALAVMKLIRDKKRGNTCSNGCGSCSRKNDCHR